MSSPFFVQFLGISTWPTVLFLLVLAASFVLLLFLKKRGWSFSKRVILATVLGLVAGLLIQVVAGFPAGPESVTFVAQTTLWYGLFGNGFIALVRMLVIPLVMVSIIHVILDADDAGMGKLTRLTLTVTLAMVAIAVAVGLLLGAVFGLGRGVAQTGGSSEIREVQTVVDTLLALLPANPVAAMVDSNIIALVIFSAFLGLAAKRMAKKYPDQLQPFFGLVEALHKIITSVAMSVIKLMPYAVVALLADTIAGRGIHSIVEVLKFIGVLYLAVAAVFVIQLLALLLFGIGPGPYLKKGFSTMIMAFTSRSSVGTLPMTVSTLTRRLGVSEGSANFVASFGSTAGMQGCAGVFPALLVVYVANVSGTPVNITFLVMAVIVITISSLGIAGIPGTATVAASAALSGMGMGALFPLVSPILAIDPIVDMGRTLVNVTGAMVNSLIVDKRLGKWNEAAYKDMTLTAADDDSELE